MLQAETLNFYPMDCTAPPHSSIDVKIEEDFSALTATPRATPLVSHPLASTSLSNATAPIRPTHRARSHTLAVASSRHPYHPYLTSTRDTQPTFCDSIPPSVFATMSGQTPYAAWPRSIPKDESNAGYIDAQPSGLVRRSSYGDRYPSQAVFGTYAQHLVQDPSSSSRPQSSGSQISTSSLAGAMGDSPPDPALVWATGSTSSSPPYPTGYRSHPSTSTQPYPDMMPTMVPRGLSQTLSPTPSHASSPYQSYRPSRAASSSQSPPNMNGIKAEGFGFTTASGGLPHGYAPSAMAPADAPPLHASAEEEIRQLRKKIRELELVNESGRMRVHELEAELAKDHLFGSGSGNRGSAGAPHGSPPNTTPQPSTAFQASWRARTDARTKQFCALNRAGNALCAWHETRRERRAYPPRMAPPGHLNCGCTFEEALFEESLARHGVGSYHPGESVRMDPALRNPLLKLLQTRYNYTDGDFERNPTTGNWVDGEGPHYWEQKALLGLTHKRSRGDSR